MLDFHPSNPFRTIDWRWRRAGNFVDGGPALSRKRDDIWVHRASKFRSVLEKCKSEADATTLMLRDPPMYWAYLTWLNRQKDEFKMITHGLEARLLSTQPAKEIVTRTRMDVETVEVYAAVFFDVEGKHDFLDYIAAMVIGPSVQTGLRSRHYDVLWKMFGWGFGPVMVDMLVTRLPQRMIVSDRQAGLAAAADHTRGNMVMQGMLASQMLELNSFTIPQVIQLYNQFVEIEASGGKNAGTQQTIMNHVGVMMTKLPFRVGQGPPPEATANRAISVPQLAYYDGGAAELRGDELLKLSAGEAIDLDPSAVGSPFRPLNVSAEVVTEPV